MRQNILSCLADLVFQYQYLHVSCVEKLRYLGSRMCIMYPLVICYMAIENGPVEIVDLPTNSIVIFNSYVNVYQRVNLH